LRSSNEEMRLLFPSRDNMRTVPEIDGLAKPRFAATGIGHWQRYASASGAQTGRRHAAAILFVRLSRHKLLRASSVFVSINQDFK